MTDYICQHCHQPAYSTPNDGSETDSPYCCIHCNDPAWPVDDQYGGHRHERGRTSTDDHYCYPEDPDSPTCHAIPTEPERQCPGCGWMAGHDRRCAPYGDEKTGVPPSDWGGMKHRRPVPSATTTQTTPHTASPDGPDISDWTNEELAEWREVRTLATEDLGR